MDTYTPIGRAAAWRRTGRVAMALTCFTCMAFPLPAEGQYFGRNKVRYDDFRFRVLHTEHFDLHFYSEENMARDAGRMAERWYFRLADVLDHEMQSRQPLILYTDHADFQQTNVVGGQLDESTGGVTESLQRRVVLPLGAAHHETDHVLGHEIVHAFQYDIAARAGGIARMSTLPLWTIEGMAEYLSLGRHDSHTAMWLRDAVLHDDVPTMRKLSNDGRYFPYRYGHAVWAYIGGRFGDHRVGELYRAALREGWDRAIQRVFGFSADSLSKEWIATVKATYEPLLADRAAPDSVVRRIADIRRLPGEMMLGPAASPDGSFVAFLWAREFSFDLYLADGRTGEIVKRLASGATESHFDAVSFMGSAGAWSPDGQRLATVVFAGGGQELAIIDVDNGRIERRIRIDGVHSIASPAWSPDGGSIVFSGSAHGVRNLYLLELASDAARRLTDDRFTQLQPTWSPDGGTIAFITDRGTAERFAGLVHEPMRVALLDVASGDIRLLSLLAEGQHTNPQFTASGRALYFLSDADGFRDLYRTDLETGEVFRVTRLATGVSGLTALSPALSVASQTGDIFFSVFERRGYVLAALDSAAARNDLVNVAGAVIANGAAVARPTAAVAATRNGGSLPPHDAVDRVERYLAEPGGGLPETSDFTTSAYAARPRLSYVGIPSIGVGVDRFGAGVYAQLEAYFTDILGDHGIYVMGLANGGWKELGGQLLYERNAGRLNWGVGGAHIPYLNRYAYARPALVMVEGEQVPGTVTTEYRERVQYDQATLSTRYPLSTTRRIELTTGVLHVGYDFEARNTIEVGNRVIDRQTTQLATPLRFTMWQASAAFVGDRSIFGIASPVDGARYRFEIQPTIGTLDYVTALADWRRYSFRRPFTLAVRALHYGRYGKDAERAELGSLFLGSPSLVRGYDYYSFTAAECAATSDGPTGCAALDRLFGSRLAVTSLEARLPLFGIDRYGLLNFPFLPTELAAFVDAGVAWTSNVGPSFSFAADPATRGAVASAGMSARFNLFGALIIEAFYAVPFQRATGGRFGFQLEPGW